MHFDDDEKAMDITRLKVANVRVFDTAKSLVLSSDDGSRGLRGRAVDQHLVGRQVKRSSAKVA